MKSIVLLSGGLDSAVSLAYALKETEVFLCLTIDYGQQAALRELRSAFALSAYYKVRHQTVSLPFLSKITATALVDRNQPLPEPEIQELDNLEASSESAVSVWVPNRNGVFINVAASFAEAYGCSTVVTGFNREEAATFPDNSPEYVTAVNKALHYSTLNRVNVVSYTQRLDKVEIIKLGMRLGVPFKYVWSCYRGGETMCRRCESCLRFIRAAEKAGLGEI